MYFNIFLTIQRLFGAEDTFTCDFKIYIKQLIWIPREPM